MDQFLAYLATVAASVIASSGFWAWLQKRSDKKDAKTQLLIGLAHDRIISLGEMYINRGSITPEEYENLFDYLYTPYHKAGGNGSADKMIKEVDRLQVKPSGGERDET